MSSLNRCDESLAVPCSGRLDLDARGFDGFVPATKMSVRGGIQRRVQLVDCFQREPPLSPSPDFRQDVVVARLHQLQNLGLSIGFDVCQFLGRLQVQFARFERLGDAFMQLLE